MSEEELVQCRLCLVPKPRSAYVAAKTTKNKLRGECKACHCERMKARYAADPKAVNASSVEWRKNNKEKRNNTETKWRTSNPEKHLLQSVRNRGKGCNLELSDIVIPEVCPALGIPLEVNTKDRTKRPDNIPSIDRVDPTKGYVKGNVRIISFRANRIKQDATEEELRAIAAYMVARGG